MTSKTHSDRKQGRLLYHHLVFHTKYNRPLLKDKIRIRAQDIISETLDNLGCEVVKINVQPTYVHILIGYPPKLSMARIANKVKGKSSRVLRQEFPILKNQCQKALWAPKYSVYN